MSSAPQGIGFRIRTGNFRISTLQSEKIVDLFEESVIPEEEKREAIKLYGLGRVNRVEGRNGPNFIIQWIRRRSLIRYLVNWGRLSSLFPVHLTTACCSVEFAGSVSPRYDPERFGFLNAVGSLRQSDVIVIEGTVTTKMAQRVRIIYDQMPDPKWVVAMGACAISGGLYAKDSYNVIQGVDDIVPVDVYVPGCPPRPEALIQGLLLLRDKILGEFL
ncbi:MAG: NADH-quinone oxidoreductase subunit NuoB [Nitrososphaerota archaeon]